MTQPTGNYAYMVGQGDPLVSVVIAVYNRAAETLRAVRSVLKQTYGNIELIVVDDCSSDGTFQALKDYQDSLDGGRNFTLLRTEKNHGFPSNARNMGIATSRGKYVAFLDNDDWFLPDKIRKQVELFETLDEGYGLVYCGYVRLFDTGEVIREVRPVFRDTVYGVLLRENIIGSCTPMVRREVFDKVGGYDEEVLCFEDRDMMMRIGKEYKFDFVDEVLACYQHSGGQLSHSERSVSGREYILRKHFDDIKGDRRLLASHYHWLGCNLFLKGEVAKARGYERLAVKASPVVSRQRFVCLCALLVMRTSRRLFIHLTNWRFRKWGD